MTKAKALKVVNALLGLVFLGVAIPGLIQTIAPGAIPYSQFRQIHPFMGTTFVVLILIHLYLNFNWIKANYLKKK